MSKLCKRCNNKHPLKNFHKDKAKRDGRHIYCKSCRKLIQREYKEKNRYLVSLKEYKWGLKKRYGITWEDYNIILKEQNYRCAICNIKYNKRLHVDHCHKTKMIRGLLCRECNHGLGQFRDNINSLKNAVIYLEKMEN